MAYNFPNVPSDNQVYADYTYKADDQVWRKTEPAYGGLPCGAIIPWAGSVAPANYLLCDGSAVSRTTYASLFGLVGTTYGAGDGSTTFNVPDLRGRIPVGKNGGSFGTLGSTGGVESVTLTEAQMPSHTHIQNSHNHSHRQWIFNGAGASGYHYGFGYSTGGAPNDSGAASGSGEVQYGNFATTATNQNAGGGQSHTNLQPYQVVNYIIKTTVAETAGESELAPRVGTTETKITSAESKIAALETPDIISGQMGTVASITTAQKIAFDEFWVQRGITYNSGTRRFTVAKSGIYRIQMAAFTLSGYSGTRLLIGVNNDAPNSANHRGMIYNQDSNHSSMDLHSVVQLNVGDWIVFYLQAGALYNSSNDRFNQFSIERIGS